MELIEEMRELGFINEKSRPTVQCKLFEDNSGALTLARAPAMRPRTKHINNKYHHFRTHVASGAIEILPIKSEDQLADFLTKPLNQEDLERHRLVVMGW